MEEAVATLAAHCRGRSRPSGLNRGPGHPHQIARVGGRAGMSAARPRSGAGFCQTVFNNEGVKALCLALSRCFAETPMIGAAPRAQSAGTASAEEYSGGSFDNRLRVRTRGLWLQHDFFGPDTRWSFTLPRSNDLAQEQGVLTAPRRRWTPLVASSNESDPFRIFLTNPLIDAAGRHQGPARRVAGAGVSASSCRISPGVLSDNRRRFMLRGVVTAYGPLGR